MMTPDSLSSGLATDAACPSSATAVPIAGPVVVWLGRGWCPACERNLTIIASAEVEDARCPTCQGPTVLTWRA